ncbi:MAG: DNA-directed RNA polymerase subunit omega [Bacteroidota bacterium]
MPLKPIRLEDITNPTGGIYEAIVVAAKRARQIHQDIKIELNQRLETIAQLQTIPESEDEGDITANPDQLRISLEFELRQKPTEQSLEELTAKKIAFRYKEVEPPPADEEETA